MSAHFSLASFSSHDNDDDEDDEDNAEIVSLSSILNRGPEFKLQWHAVSQDQDLDPNVDTYPYPYTYPIPRSGVAAVIGSETVRVSSSTPAVDDSIHSPVRSSTPRTPTYNRFANNVKADHETTAGDSCFSPGSGSLTASSSLHMLTSASAHHDRDIGANNATAIDHKPLEITSHISGASTHNQPHASLLSHLKTTPTISVATAAAAATATNTTTSHVHHDSFSLSAMPCSSNTLCDIIDGDTTTDTSCLHQQEDADHCYDKLSHNFPQQPKQGLDTIQPSSSQQDLIGSASTVFEDDLDDSDDEFKGPSDRKMDLIAALGIADLPDRASSPGPQDIPFSFFTEEPTFHAFQDPASCQLFDARRYTADGSTGYYSNGKDFRRLWMEQTDETVVHLPQAFFDRYGSFQQDLDGDGLGDDFDGEFEHEEIPQPPRRIGRRLSLGAAMAGLSNSDARSTGHHAMTANSIMMMNMMMLSAPDEDVAHLVPIPFSELPSLTSIGLCERKIVKLSSNIRLLSSTTSIRICCNNICVIPPEIGFLRNLTILDISRNSLMAIPETIGFLSKLVELRLSGNFIESLPSSISGLTKLTHLSLESNQLKRIPRLIGNLKALTYLALDDNPLTVLPSEIGQLQYLRRLKLERCPLVKEFVHSPVHSPPTLIELAARVILRQGIVVPTLLPPHLKSYLRTAQKCSFCDGPFFESSFKRGKMINKNEVRVPLEYTLCMPHWNTDMERVKLLFGPRPITSPKPRTLRRATITTAIGVSTTNIPEDSSTTTTATATATTSAVPMITRRHVKSESAGPVLASTGASVLGNSSSSSTSASPVGHAPTVPASFSLTHLGLTSATPLPNTESSSNSGGGGGGSTVRKSRGFRAKFGSAGNSSSLWSAALGHSIGNQHHHRRHHQHYQYHHHHHNSGWFSPSNNNSETNLTAAAALPPTPMGSTSTISTMTSIAATSGIGYHDTSSGIGQTMVLSSHLQGSLLSARKKPRFSNPFASRGGRYHSHTNSINYPNGNSSSSHNSSTSHSNIRVERQNPFLS
ncbi:hypothetical protein FBU30_003648 [Linnemannia zychae]|nr:hypothetical protein FBU30_003648 [Linnemannia zychae]